MLPAMIINVTNRGSLLGGTDEIPPLCGKGWHRWYQIVGYPQCFQRAQWCASWPYYACYLGWLLSQLPPEHLSLCFYRGWHPLLVPCPFPRHGVGWGWSSSPSELRVLSWVAGGKEAVLVSTVWRRSRASPELHTVLSQPRRQPAQVWSQRTEEVRAKRMSEKRSLMLAPHWLLDQLNPEIPPLWTFLV